MELAPPPPAAAALRARLPLRAAATASSGLLVLGLVVLAAAAAATLPPHLARRPQDARYYAAIAGAFACYVLALALLRRGRGPVALVLVIAALVQAAPLAGPVILSQDAGAYWDYARIAAVDGGNPYSQPPIRFRRDVAYRAVAGAWRRTTSAYGPLFTAASEGGALAAGRSYALASTIFRAAAALGALALAALAAVLSRRQAFAAAVVGWNPLFAMHFGGGGHNDVWMMVPLLGALALDRRGRRQLAGALWAVAAAVKWIPLLLLPLRAADRRRGFGWAGFAAAAVAAVALSTALYGGAWLGAFGPVAHDVASGTRTSAAHMLHTLGIPRGYAAAALIACFGAAYLLLLAKARRRRVRLGLTAALLLLATPWILPWYVAWAVPLAAAEDDAAAIAVSVVLSGYLLVARAPL